MGEEPPNHKKCQMANGKCMSSPDYYESASDRQNKYLMLFKKKREVNNISPSVL